MKTKGILTALAAFAISIPLCNAQNGLFEARLDLGYGFIANPGSVETVSGNMTTDVPYSLGSGLNLGLSGSYFLSNHIGVGLDLNAMSGMHTTYIDEEGAFQVTNTLWGNMFSLTPFLVLSARRPGINPYGRFGIVLAVPTATLSQTEAGPGAPTGTNIDYTTGNLALGYFGAFGVEIPLSGAWFLNVEIFDRAVQWEPQQTQNTQAYDGTSTSPTITYMKSVTHPDANTRVASYSGIYSPFSSLGINVGINFKFGNP